MTEHLSIKEWTTNILGHLEETCNIAHLMMQDGFITRDEYEKYFNNAIAQMEDRVRSVEESIKCEHHDITVTSTNDAYGCGIIEVTWECNDCGTVMEGQLNMEELWRYDTTAKEIQMNFEKVKQ